MGGNLGGDEVVGSSGEGDKRSVTAVATDRAFAAERRNTVADRPGLENELL